MEGVFCKPSRARGGERFTESGVDSVNVSGSVDTDAFPASRGSGVVALAAVGAKGGREGLAPDGLLAVLGAPCLVALPQLGGGRELVGVEPAAVGEEVAERVVLGPVVVGVVADDLGDGESVALPLEAALNGPGEDGGLHVGVGAKRDLDALVAFGFGDDLREGQLEDAAPHGGVVGVDASAGRWRRARA